MVECLKCSCGRDYIEVKTDGKGNVVRKVCICEKVGGNVCEKCGTSEIVGILNWREEATHYLCSNCMLAFSAIRGVILYCDSCGEHFSANHMRSYPGTTLCKQCDCDK